jgi:hypothetical protein
MSNTAKWWHRPFLALLLAACGESSTGLSTPATLRVTNSGPQLAWTVGAQNATTSLGTFGTVAPGSSRCFQLPLAAALQIVLSSRSLETVSLSFNPGSGGWSASISDIVVEPWAPSAAAVCIPN